MQVEHGPNKNFKGYFKRIILKIAYLFYMFIMSYCFIKAALGVIEKLKQGKTNHLTNLTSPE